MASANSIALQASTAVVVLLFTFAGVMKLIPAVNPSMHAELKGEFGRFSRVPPLDLLKLDPTIFMTLVGVVELACVSMILLLENRFRILGTYLLLIIILGALYVHFMVGDKADVYVPVAIGLGALLVRLYTLGRLEFKMKFS